MLFVDSSSSSSSITLSSYVTSLSGTFYTAQNGIFTVNSLVLISAPNTTQLLKFTTNDINPSFFYNKNSKYSITEVLLQVSVRLCLPGEEITSKGECVTCSVNSYMLEQPKAGTKCKACPSEFATCLGGARIYPRSGFWRTSNSSDNFI